MEFDKKTIIKILLISIVVAIVLAFLFFIPATAHGWKIVLLKDVELLVK